MKNKKLKYEAPIVYDLTHAVKDEVYAARCRTGTSATGNCNVGNSAGRRCRNGFSAAGNCNIGQSPGGVSRCRAGNIATDVCRLGGLATVRCRAGALK